jgi:hypothetical protein
MKAPTAGFAILNLAGHPLNAIAYGLTRARPIAILDTTTGRIVWRGKTVHGARNAHYRLSLERITGKKPSIAQARRAGNP